MATTALPDHLLLERSAIAETLRLLIKILAPTAAVEFFLLRVFMRVSFALRADSDAVALLLHVSQVAFNVALLISSLALAVMAILMAAHVPGIHSPWRPLSPLILAVILLGLLLVAAPSSYLLVAFNILSIAVLLATAALAGRWGGRGSLLVSVVASVYVMSHYYNLASISSGFGVRLPGALGLFSVGEGLTLVAAGVAFLVLGRRWDRSAAVVASCVAAVFLSSSLSPMLPLLTTWALNFTLYLPPWAYAAALWLYIYTLTTLLRQRSKAANLTAFALVFIALAGIMLNMTYLSQLGLLGVLMLALLPQRWTSEAAD